MELHRTRILSAQLLEASSRRDAPRARYIKRVTKVRGDIERYNNLAGRQKQVVKFNMSYHIGHGFKEIKIRCHHNPKDRIEIRCHHSPKVGHRKGMACYIRAVRH